ncbi:hypothetical protein ACIRD3_37160 [Kitasatospora sp. NPDC093550]|uniref:hypothetical protein n=1 Tax=Kitasatospora sp. NPDC093550 TaxID=3364089 RepID=UPI003808F0FD
MPGVEHAGGAGRTLCGIRGRYLKLFLHHFQPRAVVDSAQDENEGDGWREYDDAVPVLATTLELLATRGPLGPVWWRYGRPGRHSLLDALENPDNRAAYNQRQKAREKRARQEHREWMRTLACADCGKVPKEESTWHYGPDGSRLEWNRQPGGRCWTCHQDREERLEREAEEQLEAARTANAALRHVGTLTQRNAQTLRNGDLLVGWGSQPYVSEFSRSGDLLFNARFPEGVNSYRAYRFDWK